MKIIYSLKEFKDEVKKIAASIPESYCTAQVSLDYNDILTFQCYIYNYGGYMGSTMEEALQKLRNCVNPQTKTDIDVEIEITEKHPETTDITSNNNTGN